MKIGNLEVYGIIYKIENLVNGKVYIGQTTVGFNSRYRIKTNGDLINGVYKYHNYKKNSNKNYNIHLLKSIEKYGFNSFKVCNVIDVAFSKEELNIKEQCWIKLYNSTDGKYGYNIMIGGMKSPVAEITKKKLRQSNIDSCKARAVYQLDKNTYKIISKYESISIATESLKLSRSAIKNVLNINYKNITAGGFCWEYVDEQNIKYTEEYKNKMEQNKHKITRIPKEKKVINHDIRDNILKLYDNGLKPIEIIRLGFASTTVRRYLSKYRNYETKEMLSKENIILRDNNIIELYLKGFRNCEIEKELILSRRVVQKTISKYNDRLKEVI